MQNERLVQAYVALVKDGRRALDENENNITIVPAPLNSAVRQAIENEEA